MTLATHKTTLQVPRQRTRVVDSSGAAPASMHVHGRAGKPKQLARNAKNPGKTRVFERRGLEPNNLQIPWEKLGFQNEATRNLTRAAKQSTHRQRALQRTSDGFGIQVTRVCPAIFERTAVDSSCLHIPLSRICSLAAPAACRVLDRKSSQCSGSEHAEA